MSQATAVARGSPGKQETTGGNFDLRGVAGAGACIQKGREGRPRPDAPRGNFLTGIPTLAQLRRRRDQIGHQRGGVAGGLRQEVSLRPSGRTPPGSRKYCQTGGPPPFSGSASLSNDGDGRHRPGSDHRVRKSQRPHSRGNKHRLGPKQRPPSGGKVLSPGRWDSRARHLDKNVRRRGPRRPAQVHARLSG